MAQTNYTPISLYYSTTASAVPTAANLVQGELAINTNDGKLYYEDSSGVVRVLASKSTGSIGGSTTQVQYNNAGSLAGSANFVFDGTNVGIGVTPSAQFSGIKSLQIGSTTNLFDNTTSTKFYHNAYTATSGNETYLTTGYAQGYLMTSNGQHQWYIAASGTAGNTFSFTQAMTLDASGRLLLNQTSNNGTALMQMICPASTDGILVQIGTNGNNAMSFLNAGGAANVGSITVSSTLTAYNVTSDYRLKENIVPMTGALATVAQLKPVTYKWKVDGSDGQGFIAHELQAVVPDCDTGEKDAVDAEGKPKYQGMDASFLIATLTKAIQEQQALIESLTTRLTALENK